MINTIYKRGRIYWLKYRLHGETGKPLCLSLGTSDKQVAERLRGEKLAEFERERAGILAPKSMREAACCEFVKLLEEYVQDVRARGKAVRYADNLEARLNSLAVACGWKRLRDVTAESFTSWRANQQLAPKTLNEYLNAASGLLNWLQRHGRVPANPLRTVGRVETRGRETRQRRAFTESELARLFNVAGNRKAVYVTAAYTGLRRGELEQLEWVDVHLEDVAQPFLEARASTTKNHRKATIQLHGDVVTALRDHQAKKGGKGDGVFVVPTIETFRHDLERAGIPYKDAQGRVADFHSLRVTLCTNLQKAGVPQRVAQEIMRHSGPELTARVYTDTASLHTWSAIEKLPSVAGTTLYQGLYQKTAVGGHSAPVPVTMGFGLDIEQSPVNIGSSHTLAEAVTAGQFAEWCAQQELNLQPLVP